MASYLTIATELESSLSTDCGSELISATVEKLKEQLGTAEMNPGRTQMILDLTYSLRNLCVVTSPSTKDSEKTGF